MGIIYQNVQEIVGPLLFIKNNHKVKFGEFVKIKESNGRIRTGQVVKMDKHVITVEVFESTSGLSLEDSDITFTNDSFRLKLSTEMRGKTFNSLGVPIDIQTKKEVKTRILTAEIRRINATPINPISRLYPSDIIQTGVSAIDGLFTLVRGQKLPIFSAQGLPHNQLVAQIISQAKVLTEEPFLIIFCGIGIIHDEAIEFIDTFRRSGQIQNIISFLNFADDPIMERLIIPRVALTTAEYFAFEHEMHVLIVLVDITNYAEALRELSSAKEEIPSRKGFPGYLYSDFASIFERTGKIKGSKGSITQIPVLTMPNDDISHPIPDTAGFITEGQIVLSRELHKKGIYPPLDVLASISRLMKDAIGEDTTREDHPDVSSQLLASYSEALEVRELISIVGKDGLKLEQKALLEYADEFEKTFLHQEIDENREFETTFNFIWKVLSKLPKAQLYRIHKEYIKKYYDRREE